MVENVFNLDPGNKVIIFDTDDGKTTSANFSLKLKETAAHAVGYHLHLCQEISPYVHIASENFDKEDQDLWPIGFMEKSQRHVIRLSISNADVGRLAPGTYLDVYVQKKGKKWEKEKLFDLPKIRFSFIVSKRARKDLEEAKTAADEEEESTKNVQTRKKVKPRKGWTFWEMLVVGCAIVFVGYLAKAVIDTFTGTGANAETVFTMAKPLRTDLNEQLLRRIKTETDRQVCRYETRCFYDDTDRKKCEKAWYTPSVNLSMGQAGACEAVGLPPPAPISESCQSAECEKVCNDLWPWPKPEPDCGKVWGSANVGRVGEQRWKNLESCTRTYECPPCTGTGPTESSKSTSTSPAAGPSKSTPAASTASSDGTSTAVAFTQSTLDSVEKRLYTPLNPKDGGDCGYPTPAPTSESCKPAECKKVCDDLWLWKPQLDCSGRCGEWGGERDESTMRWTTLKFCPPTFHCPLCPTTTSTTTKPPRTTAKSLPKTLIKKSKASKKK